MRSCVLIPSFNGAQSIGAIVKSVKEQGLDVIVVDDGSLDLTAQRASESGAVVLQNSRNRGKGASLRKGFDYALAKGYDAVITMDGDGQHLAEDLPLFLKAHKENPQAEMIIGNRMHQPLKMPLERQMTNRFMSRLISWICHQRIPDSQNGFRLITSNLLKRWVLKSDRFEIESEMILEAATHEARIVSTEITSVYENHPSFISPLLDTGRFIKFIVPYIHFFKKK